MQVSQQLLLKKSTHLSKLKPLVHNRVSQLQLCKNLLASGEKAQRKRLSSGLFKSLLASIV